MTRQVGIVLLALMFATIGSNHSYATGAVAVGLPKNGAHEGFSFGIAVNAADVQGANKRALEECRKSGSTKSKALCRVVNNFHDQCAADAMDPKAGTPGVGWAVAEDKRSAESLALAKCEETAGPGRHATCRVFTSMCDGNSIESTSSERSNSLSSQATEDCKRMDGTYSGTCKIKSVTSATSEDMSDETGDLTVSIKQTGCDKFELEREGASWRWLDVSSYTVKGSLYEVPNTSKMYLKAIFYSAEGILNLHQTFMGADGVLVEARLSQFKLNRDSMSFDYEDFNLRQGRRLKVVSCPSLQRR